MPDHRYEFQIQKTVYSPNDDAAPDNFNFTRTGEKALADNHNLMAVGDLSDSMRLKEQTDGVVSNVYGVGFTEKLTDKERTSARKKSGRHSAASTVRLPRGREDTLFPSRKTLES
jgi:hypothetical protein